jgi:hypothetical protein
MTGYSYMTKAYKNSFSSETSRISPVSGDFVCFLQNPKFRSLKITRKIQARSLILISDRLVEFRFFVFTFWPVWGLKPELHNEDEYTKRPTDLSEKIRISGDVSFIGQCLKYSERNHEVSHKFYQKRNFGVI